jgi:hypothetical protein
VLRPKALILEHTGGEGPEQSLGRGHSNVEGEPLGYPIREAQCVGRLLCRLLQRIDLEYREVSAEASSRIIFGQLWDVIPTIFFAG